MKPTKHKLVAGKRGCDRCRARAEAIFECSWPWSRGTGSVYHADCCDPCFSVMERHWEGGGLLGPYGELEALSPQAKAPRKGNPS